MTDIITNIDPIEPLSDEEVKEYQLNREKIVLELGYFGGYMAKIANARAKLQKQKGDLEVEVLKIDTQLNVLGNYTDIGKVRMAALKQLLKEFPREPKQTAPSAL